MDTSRGIADRPSVNRDLDLGAKRAGDPESGAESGSRISWAPVIWLLGVAAFAAYLVFGTVTAQAGNYAGDRFRILTLWSQFTGLLEERGIPGPVIVLVWLAAAVALVASLAACWLAYAAGRDAESEPPEA